MEIKIKENIENAIKRHRVLSEKLLKETTELVTDPSIVTRLLKRHSPEMAAKALQDEINGMVLQASDLDKLHNAEVKKNISEAKLAAMPEEVRAFVKPADYQQQISNALAFLTLEGERLTDQAAFAILKPFFNDWEQMHLFERAVLQQMHLENECMTRSAFPTALGAVLDKADTYTALFGEAEMLAERLFIRKKEHTSACEIGEFPVYGGCGLDSYDEVAAEERIVELAGLIETLGSDKAFVYDSADFKYGQIYQARHQIGSVSPTDTDAGFVWL